MVVKPPFGLNAGTPAGSPGGAPVNAIHPPSIRIVRWPWASGGQVAVSVTTIGSVEPPSPIPTWNHALSFPTCATGVFQPTGRVDTQGSFVAVGTACANVIIVRSASQFAGSTVPRVGKNNG